LRASSARTSIVAASEPVERSDREARLDEADVAERGLDGGPRRRQVRRVEVRRLGEVEQEPAAGYSLTTSEGGRHVELVAER
jgi:hypothetical protein